MLFLHSFDAGGVERVALRLAGAWAAVGCEVRIAMGRRGGPLTPEAPPGVPLDFAPPFAWARHGESLWLVPHLVAMVRRHRPDVLFCAGNTYAVVAVLARLLLGRACPPIVCKVSNSLDRRDFSPPMRWLYGLWLRVQTLFIDRFVGLAEGMRAELSQALKIADERIDIIDDPALSLNQISWGPARVPPAAGSRLFVAVGRLTPQKDFSLLLRAFAIRPVEGDRLLILGEGRERPRLRRLARRLGVAHLVSLPGHVTDVALWLARADALVLSSRYEGVPAVVIEALAQGTPVIATDCCASMGALLGNGAFGQLAPVGDAPALSAAMRDFDGQAYDAEAMRTRARQFTVERAAPHYLLLMAHLQPSPRGAVVVEA
ncbi:MAG TPA: glycosyltransferase [Caulobacteraceae bacterium]|jgi:glycosyltransferase involved in cell wall biosynthesis|nr:glycosyltransferase [Caulobacteraceae bacterium]